MGLTKIMVFELLGWSANQEAKALQGTVAADAVPLLV